MIYHQCLEQELIAVGKREPTGKKPKCRCRQQVSPEVAAKLIADGRAKHLVVGRAYVNVDVLCQLCKGDETFINCALCGGKRTMKEQRPIETFNREAIVATSVDRTSRKYRPSVAAKTPRVATIEKAHIERNAEGRGDARERLEAYGQMIKEFQASLIVGYEPPDDPKTMTGRKYDYGRPVLYTPSVPKE